MVPGAEEQIESHLPHRDRLRVAEQLGERVELASVGRCRLVRMPSAREVHARMILGDPPVAIGVLEVESDRDDLVHPGGGRALERLVEQPALLEQDEVAVGVDERRQRLRSRRAPTTTVHSPRGGRAVNSSTSDAAVPRCNVSCSLVSSRATTTGRSPRTGVASRSVLVIRIGDSKNAMVRSSRIASSRTRTSLPAVRGRKPRKQNALAGKAARCERRGERRCAGNRRHAMTAVECGAHQDGARIAQRGRARIRAERERLPAFESLDELRYAASLVERGQRQHRFVHAVRAEQRLGAPRILGDHRVAFAQHAQRAQRDVLEVADRRRDHRERSGRIAHRPQSRG